MNHTLQVVTSWKSQSHSCYQDACPYKQEGSTILRGDDQLLVEISARLSEIAEPIQELVKDKVPFN